MTRVLGYASCARIREGGLEEGRVGPMWLVDAHVHVR
jgi:hypothetical protein